MSLNTPEFEEFEKRRGLWIECLCGKDFHSVMREVSRMIWNAAAFRVVNESRLLAPPAKEGGVQINGLTHRLIDNCFFESQAVAIRRLMDTYPLEGRKGVYSLAGLLDDMAAHAHLITREHVFAIEGLEYDYEAAKEAVVRHCRQRDPHGTSSFSLPARLDWGRIRELHEMLDRLAGVDPQARSKQDSVRPAVFAALKKKVADRCREVSDYVNKRLAHAATPESREDIDAGEVSITLGHLWDAHEVICKVANFLDCYLLTGTSHSFLPVPQYNQFAYIDRPMVPTDQVNSMKAIWREYQQETRDWSGWGLNELEAEGILEGACGDT